MNSFKILLGETVKNKSLSVFKHFCFIAIYLSVSFFFASAGEQDGMASSGEMLSNPVVIHDSMSNPLFRILYMAIKNIKSLNYYTARGVVIPLLGTNQEIFFNWGFKASGNLFMPLATVRASVRTNFAQSLLQEKRMAPKDIGYAILQNELFKYTKNTSLVKWLVQANLNPTMLFALKLALLIKTTVSGVRPAGSSIYIEIMRLIFRLNLSEEFNILDKQQPLSSIIPLDIKNAAESQIPGCMEFIDEVWGQLTLSMPQMHVTKYYTINGFVFRDKAFFEKLEKALVNYKGARFVNDVTQLINLRAHQVVNFNDFNTYSTSKELVGFLCAMHMENKHLPDAIKKNIAENTTLPLCNFLITNDNEQWLYNVSDKLDTIGTLKAVILTFTRALHDYIILKKEFLNGQDSCDSSYRKQWEASERTSEIIQAFLETDDGMRSFDRLSQEIAKLKEQNNGLAQRFLGKDKLKKELTQDLQRFEKQRDALFSDIERREILKNANTGEELVRVQAATERIKKQYDEICALVKQTQDKLERLNSEMTSSELLEQDKKNLEALLALLIGQQDQGQTPSGQLLTTIAGLQNKIKVATSGQASKMDIENRLKNRLQYATVFTIEASIMEKQLNEKKAVIQAISSEEQRTIQELLFGQQQEGYIAYIQRLQEEAQKIITQNQQASDLKRYKKALNVVDITLMTKEQQQIIKDLEDSVGYLFTAAQEENFLETIGGTKRELREFIADLKTGPESFKKIKTTLIDSISNILNSSEHIQNNIILYQYLIGAFIPELFPMLSPIVDNIS
jgi:hypothetical protein